MLGIKPSANGGISIGGRSTPLHLGPTAWSPAAGWSPSSLCSGCTLQSGARSGTTIGSERIPSSSGNTTGEAGRTVGVLSVPPVSNAMVGLHASLIKPQRITDSKRVSNYLSRASKLTVQAHREIRRPFRFRAKTYNDCSGPGECSRIHSWRTHSTPCRHRVGRHCVSHPDEQSLG